MVIKPKNTVIAYRCPECASAIMSVVGVFALSGDLIKLKCDCGGSELTISYTGDGKIRLSVPCFICGTPHHFLLSEAVFFGRELFTLSCPYSGMDICFIGEKDQVTAALSASEEELAEMMDLEGFQRDHEEDGQPPYEELGAIIVVLKELLMDGRLRCRCVTRSKISDCEEGEVSISEDSPEDICFGDYKLKCEDGSFVLVCKTCGAKYRIPTDSLGLGAFYDADMICLK